MPTCQNCDTKWDWAESIKKSFTLDNSMECPYCKRKQYVSKKSRRRMSFGNFIGPFVLLILLMGQPILVIVSAAVGLFALVMCLYPFLMELSNEEEPLW
ncbi:hypothetical protein KO561_03905 [Radiobacillus kanasensis]|uniref:TIGR04104 family putative zinc finger protein n=1 Tax=Radiobacillus kanasensis TaxID=2844358 RepID=UPI001E3B5369|nr:TIGR04104 family putative zinc finger protein [Radiobacillus kanasensis]UFU00118.1 hypothetical protein KO561_03905 [Radiobacillus kanasensis]